MDIVNLSPAEFFSLDDFMYFQQDRLDDETTECEVNSILEMTKMQGLLNILDTPCGYGRHSKSLMKLGHFVTGIDLSPCFIEQAKIHQYGDRGRFFLEEMDYIVGESQFSLIVILFNSFGYYPHPRNMRFLERCAHQLVQSGKIVIDTINSCNLLSSGFMNTVVIRKKDDSLIIEKERASEQYEKGINLKYTITSQRNNGASRTTLNVIFYNPEELEEMLHQNGFTQVEFYSGLVGEREWNPESKKMVVIAQK